MTDKAQEQDDQEVPASSPAGAANATIENADSESSQNKKRKTRHGRAARRRSRKVRAIQEAEAALFGAGSGSRPDAASLAKLVNSDNGDGEQDGGRVSVPSDRHRSLPGVTERRLEQYRLGNDESNCDAKEISLDKLQGGDERLLTSQLGFIPGNAVHVAARVADCPQLRLLQSSGSSGSGIGIGIGRGSASDGTGTNEHGKGTVPAGPSPPTVLKLYPLVIRDACPKRKYKSRQRGQAVVAAPNDSSERGTTSSEQKDANNNAEMKSNNKERQQNKPARDWSVDNGEGIIEPFPTLYWLTDPRLRMLISKLEISDDSNVKTMEARIRSNPDYIASMERAHRQYGQARWELLTEQDKTAVTERGWDGAVGNERGVAGIRDARGVKCLHAHAAHYLAGGADNIVGRWTIDAAGDMLEEKMGRVR